MASPEPTIRLKCTGVRYRQGFIEVTPGIHNGCVNIEAWDVNPDVNLEAVRWVNDTSLSDEDIVANTELELTIAGAKKLATAISDAIARMEGADAQSTVDSSEWGTCDECCSTYLRCMSRMTALCPECAHRLYGFENCKHHFHSGRCKDCGWDGSVSEYVKRLKDCGSSEVDAE
jgi:hypothetical protein